MDGDYYNWFRLRFNSMVCALMLWNQHWTFFICRTLREKSIFPIKSSEFMLHICLNMPCCISSLTHSRNVFHYSAFVQLYIHGLPSISANQPSTNFQSLWVWVGGVSFIFCRIFISILGSFPLAGIFLNTCMVI